MWIKDDKSRNLYKIDPLLYKKILHDKITEKYKLYIIDQINNDTYNFTNKLNIKNKLNKVNRKMHILFLRIIDRTLKIINRPNWLIQQKLC